jgi:hypothetical protein
MSNRFLTRAQVGAEVVKFALSTVGIREDPLGSNTGVAVRRIQAATTLAKSDPTGWPWCAAGDAYWIQETWRLLGITIANPWNNSASCDELLYWARRKNILSSVPTRYSFFLSMKSEHDATHTGLVTEVQSDDEIETIEANTNTNGSREGIGIFRFAGADAKSPRGRRYINWLNLLPAAIPYTGTATTVGTTTGTSTSPTFKAQPQRLILATVPYGVDDYIALPSARLERGTWSVEGAEVARAVDKVPGAITSRIGWRRAPLREHLFSAGLAVDELRTRLGNHLGDDANPRQYVFFQSASALAAARIGGAPR